MRNQILRRSSVERRGKSGKNDGDDVVDILVVGCRKMQMQGQCATVQSDFGLILDMDPTAWIG